MVYPIFIYGSPVLRKVAKKIPKNQEGLQSIIDNLFETLNKSEGLGLAAPQIGLSIRLFVIDASAVAENEPSLKDYKKVFINPVIMERIGEPWIYSEGCLSLPGLHEDVSRPGEIKIQYYDENFNFYDERLDGMKARIIQHEYDHLDGILFIDHIPAIRRRLLQGKLNGLTKGKFEAKYKVKLPK